MESVDILIIGQGPAGLSSAIYTARAGMRTLILGCAPKVAGDYEIDNYFGFTETITGKDLIERGKAQAAKFGADIRCDRVLAIHQSETGSFVAKTEDKEIEAASVILATGVSRIRPGISNLGDLIGLSFIGGIMIIGLAGVLFALLAAYGWNRDISFEHQDVLKQGYRFGQRPKAGSPKADPPRKASDEGTSSNT